MVLGPHRRPVVAAGVVGVVAVILAVIAVSMTRPDASGEAVVLPTVRSDGSATTAPGPPPTVDTLMVGGSALVTVAVATVWNEPGMARPVDEPSLTNPVDIRRWVAAMSHEDKLWLVDRLVTQALYGERVTVLAVEGAWAKVVVTGQPSSLDPRGYPGWIPAVQLRSGDTPTTGRTAVVTRPVAILRDSDDPSRGLMDLSFNTRLPVLGVAAGEVTVALPTGGRGLLAAAEVEVSGASPRPAAGAQLVSSARLFSGLPYLWAGTSAAGFDCSGLTAAVYGVHGVVLPRDADDQASLGVPVERSRLQPGDLLFYSPDGEQRSIHHVSMYVGDGLMIQSPATGRTVETVPVDTPQYAHQFWGARRYPPAGGT